MGSLSDTLLAGGCMPNLESIHGERVQILDGVDAGKVMIGVATHEADVNVESEIMSDPRQKVMCRFTNRPGNVPSVNSKKLVKLKTADGKRWSATRQDFSSYLSTDFELVQII